VAGLPPNPAETTLLELFKDYTVKQARRADTQRAVGVVPQLRAAILRGSARARPPRRWPS